MVIRGRAPLRVSFGSGGTDVEPFCVEQGGAIIGKRFQDRNPPERHTASKPRSPG